MITQDCPGEADILEVPIAEPGSRSNRDADPMKEVKKYI